MLVVVSGSAREVKTLNGDWKFCIDAEKTGFGTYEKGLPASSVIVSVPHTWNVSEQWENYVGLAWYERSFYVPKSDKKKDIRIKFHAIYRDATIFLNGNEIGRHFSSGYTTFYIDIAKHVKYGSDNKLVISVSNEYSETAIPFKNSFDWNSDGGIIRSVEVIYTEKPAVRYAHVKAKNSGNGVIDVKLWSNPNKAFTVKLSIKERKTGKEVFNAVQNVKAKNQEFSIPFNVATPALWHFDNPNLYDVEVSTFVSNKSKDLYSTYFGFREIEIKGETICLNGEPVRLMGIEWMPGSHPDYGMAEPTFVIDEMLNNMKELNCVVTRFHWQQDEYTLRKLDEMGILVQEEVPWWGAPGNLTPEIQTAVEMHIDEMIETHYNHPSIFSWGISNEVHAENNQQYYDLTAKVKSLDPSRMRQVISNRVHLLKEKDISLIGSIPTWNDYTGSWYGKPRTELPVFLNAIKDAIKDRPLMITEAGLCEPKFKGGDARRVDDMGYHIGEWSKHSFIAVAIYFSLNDYRTHMGEGGEGRFKRRIHGVTGMQGERKPSFYTFKSYASPIEILNVYNEGEDCFITIRNKNKLPSYTINGYYLTYGDKRMKVPTLKPGEESILKIPANIDEISIFRPTGHNVIIHKFR